MQFAHESFGICHFCSSWLNLINPRVLKITVTNAVCAWRGWTLPRLRFECERMQLVYEIILLNTILRNHLLSENLQWNYGSFNGYPYLSHARSQNFAWHLLCLLTTEGKNIVKLLAISQTCQFQLFFTDLPRNFWKIARLLGKIKNTITLRFISIYFLSKKSSSERTCPYWQWIVFTIKIKGQWPVPMVWKKTIHAVCGRDNNNYYYFPKGKFKLFNSLFHSTYSCTLCFQFIWFLLPICLPCVICGTYEMRI